MPDKVRLDSISREPDRASCQQGFGRNAQDGLEKIHRCLAPKRPIQSLAESYSGWRCIMHGRRYEFAPTQLKESSLACSIASSPIEDADRIAVGHPRPQNLAGLVPVNQEDKGRADRFEKFVAAIAAIGRILTRDEVEHFIVAEARRALALEPAPLNGKIPQQAGEELGTREMYVGIGDRHRLLFDRDYDHMRVGFSNIVLDGEPRARPRRSRRKSGMIEFQLTG